MLPWPLVLRPPEEQQQQQQQGGADGQEGQQPGVQEPADRGAQGRATVVGGTRAPRVSISLLLQIVGYDYRIVVTFESDCIPVVGLVALYPTVLLRCAALLPLLRC